MRTEDFVFVLALLALFATLLWHRRPTVAVPVAEVSELPNARDTVGMSNTPLNSRTEIGPKYLVYNQKYAFAPPVANIVIADKLGWVH